MLGCQVIQICWCLSEQNYFLAPGATKDSSAAGRRLKVSENVHPEFLNWWIPELMNWWIEEWINDWTVLDQMTARPKRRGKWGGLRNHQKWVSQSETKGSSGDASASKNGQIGYFQHFLGVPRKTCMFSMVLCIISCDDDSFENPQRRKGMWVCSDMCCCIVCATYICQSSFYRVKFW